MINLKGIKEKIYSFFKWIKDECKDWKTFFIFVCVVIIMHFPTWGGYLMYKIFKWKWCLGMASFSAIFWAGPFTPFIPLCIAITFTIKRIVKKIKK